MPDTAEHRADMHRLATERRKAGLPVWDRKISLADVFHNDEMGFEQKRDTIVARIRATRWLRDYGEDGDLPQFVEELAGARTPDEFDGPWDCIYDIADADRVWIATF
jgi:hypothetical protein